MSDACCAPATPPADPAAAPRRLREIRAIRLAVAAGVLLAAGVVASLRGADTMALVAFAAAVLTGGLTFVPDALRGLPRGRLGVGTLMTVAAVGAVGLGEWGEAATLAFLFSISEALESYALARTRRGLRALLDLVPAVATVLRDGLRTSVPAGALAPGDRLLVLPGERIPTDGVILTGRSALDLSAITGESVPWRGDRARRCSRDRSTALRRSRSRSRPAPRTTRWRASCASWRRPRSARAAASAWRSASPVRSCPPCWSPPP